MNSNVFFAVNGSLERALAVGAHEGPVLSVHRYMSLHAAFRREAHVTVNALVSLEI